MEKNNPILIIIVIFFILGLTLGSYLTTNSDIASITGLAVSNNEQPPLIYTGFVIEESSISNITL